MFKNKELLINILHIFIGQAKKSPLTAAPPCPVRDHTRRTQSFELDRRLVPLGGKMSAGGEHQGMGCSQLDN